MKQFEIDNRAVLNKVRIEIQREIDERIAKVGLDLEVPIFNTESGDWERNWEHRIQAHYDLDGLHPKRMPKKKTFDEIAEQSESESELLPYELGRVNMKYFVKHKIDHVETSLTKKSIVFIRCGFHL